MKFLNSGPSDFPSKLMYVYIELVWSKQQKYGAKQKHELSGKVADVRVLLLVE